DKLGPLDCGPITAPRGPSRPLAAPRGPLRPDCGPKWQRTEVRGQRSEEAAKWMGRDLRSRQRRETRAERRGLLCCARLRNDERQEGAREGEKARFLAA